MFINSVEDYGFNYDERPNWINMVRKPIERLVSYFYFNVTQRIKESKQERNKEDKESPNLPLLENGTSLSEQNGMITSLDECILYHQTKKAKQV